MTTHNQLQTPLHLNGRHQHTYETIFRHPTAHNLEWHDVRSLLAALGEVTEGRDGSLQVTRNGQTVSMETPKHKDVATVEDMLALRQFLEQSGEPAIPVPVIPEAHLLVVIDHREAKIYRTEFQGAVPEKLVPYDPHGYGRHLRSDEETDGKRRPERKSFYEAVAATLQGADHIVIFGGGTGESSAMEQLLADLRHNHRDVAQHIVGSKAVDGHHLTEGQLLAQARELFSANGVQREDAKAGEDRLKESTD